MNILVLGNGFDLAHGLPTTYPDFLGFCRMIKAVYSMDKNTNADKLWTELKIKLKSEENTKRLQNKFSELYSVGVVSKDEKKGDIIRTNTVFDEMYDDINRNIWIEYFLQNPKYRSDNWIDFEREIGMLIQSVDFDMVGGEKKYGADDYMDILSNSFLYKGFLNHTLAVRTAGMLNNISHNAITFRQIIDMLQTDLSRLTRALEIYLAEYVEKMECDVISPDIKEIMFETVVNKGEENKKRLSNVLSFNYTDTYRRLYFNVSMSKTFGDFIHGKADINNTIDTNNMVLGIDEYLSEDRRNKDIEFIAFKKFYQRIYKGTGCQYKEWVERIKKEYVEYLQKQEEAYFREHKYETDNVRKMMNQLAASAIRDKKCAIHNVYIFGHSLDITDGDILRDLILHDNVYTTIFYYKSYDKQGNHDNGKKDLGQKIANLVKIIGQDELIKRTGGSTKTIEFKLQQDMVERKE